MAVSGGLMLACRRLVVGALRGATGSGPVTPGPLYRVSVVLVVLVGLFPWAAGATSVGGQTDGGSLAVAAAGGFSDAEEAGVHSEAVNSLAVRGVFEGTECAPGKFCPNDAVERWVMAVWLVRILDGADPAAVGSSRFVDVDASEWWAPYVERLADLRVTSGCSTELARFCPGETVTRARMASFLVRGFGLPQAPPAGFADVATGGVHAANIDALAASGITAGCGTEPLTYCPSRDTTRAQMATLLHRALALSGEGEDESTERDLDSTTVTAIPTHWGTVASIYNDNIFVLPVSEDLASEDNPPLEDYAGFFYEHFEDEFDFLIFVRNLVSGADPMVVKLPYYYVGVTNEVRGIGQPRFSNASNWGSSGRLQGSVFLTWVEFADLVWGEEWRLFRNGPILHELMHRWGNNIIPTSYPHWGFSSAAGVIGGFDIANLVDRGGGQYTAGSWDVAGPNKPAHFSSIELYLAGFIPPEEVPDLWVAEDGEWLYDGRGDQVWSRNNGPIFTTRQFGIYTIEDLIAEHGPRVPDASQSQKDFHAAVILLTDEMHPADPKVLKKLSDDVSWFSHAGVSGTDDRYLGVDVYNFYEATGGRGTITMDGLSEFLRVSK